MRGFRLFLVVIVICSVCAFCSLAGMAGLNVEILRPGQAEATIALLKGGQIVILLAFVGVVCACFSRLLWITFNKGKKKEKGK